MKIYCVTDTHFCHPMLLENKYRPDNYEKLLANSLKNIPEDGVLIHLGDVCMKNSVMVHEKYIQPLKCKKILVKGNHDNKSDSWYMEHGWDWVCKRFTGKYFGKRILFSHMPQDLSIDDYHDLNIHGHFHGDGSRYPELDKLITLRHVDIAPDIFGYEAINLKDFLSKYFKMPV